jgi:nucleoside-diphosphate-sugar epimerase
MKSVLVLGSRGYIGKNLISYLNKADKNLNLLYDKKKTDLSISSNWREFKKTDCLILLSSISNLNKFNTDISKNYSINLQITLNAISYCLKYNSKLIFISSASTQLLNNNYAISKFISEIICKYYSKSNLNYNILRVFNVYGDNQSIFFLIPKLFSDIKKNKKIIVNNINTKRDYIHIDDVCEAIYKSIFIKKKNITLDIGTGKSYSVKQVINFLSKILDKKIKYEVLNNYKINKNKILKSEANLILTNKYLKWNAYYSLYNGLKKLKK